MLRAAILVVILLLVLSFFGVSLRHLIEMPTTQSNFSYVGDLLQQGWNALSHLLNGLLNSIKALI